MFFDDTIRTLLKQARTIAVVGASDKESHPVHAVGQYLLRAGYCLIPVHPVRSVVWGLPVVSALPLIQTPVDIVCLFRAPQFCPAHALEVQSMQYAPRVFWMQLGISNKEAGKLMAASGIAVVEDRCIKTEHQRLLGCLS